MAATKITPVKVNPRPYARYYTSFAEADEEEGNYFTNTGREILLVQSGVDEEKKPLKPVLTFTDDDGVKKKVTLETGLTALGPFSVPGYGQTVDFLVEEGNPTLAAIKAVRP